MTDQNHSFIAAYRGSFRSALHWEHLDALWEAVLEQTDGPWYVYAVGEPPPEEPVEAPDLERFVSEVDTLLRREHDEDYCGIVYADDMQAPSFVKIYDPNNLGSSCGPGFGVPIHPGWILSRVPPVDLDAATPPPGNRRRWWQRVFGG
jgi:hypothetical protein